jgi:glycerol-3-phosphate dehydrogenase (NAD(P)+)
MKITVLGSGGWGTALSLLLLENGHDVTLWSYTEEESSVLRRTGENPMLKSVPLPDTLKMTSDLSCVRGCGVVVLATPSFAVRATAQKMKEYLDEGAVVVSVSKGIEKDTSLCLTQAIAQELGPDHPVGPWRGPPMPRRWGGRSPPRWFRPLKTRRPRSWCRSFS